MARLANLRDALIGKTVSEVIEEERCLIIEFSDGSKIDVANDSEYQIEAQYSAPVMAASYNI